MNNDRRKEITAVIVRLEALREWYEAITNELADIKDEAERIRDEEQEYYDNLPENLQQSDRAYASETAISNLDNVVDALDIDIVDFDDVITTLDSAKE